MFSLRPASRLFCFFASLCLLAAQAQVKPTLTKAPDFRLTALDGSRVTLSEYRGKVVLLDFWATWCVPCQTEVPRFISFQNRFGSKGFQVIGVSMDDSEVPVRKFHDKFKINYPIAMGTAQVAEAYGGILGLPVTYLVAPDGSVAKKYEGSADLDQMEKDIEQLISLSDKPK